MGYFVSILIWLVILTSTAHVFKNLFIENGWYSEDDFEPKDRTQTLIKCVMISAIPVFRLLLFIVMFVMAFSKKDDWL